MTTNERIKHLENKMDDKFSDIQHDFKLFRKEVRDTIQPLHDFVVGQEAIAKSATIGVPKELMNIVKWLVLIIGAILGVKGL